MNASKRSKPSFITYRSSTTTSLCIINYDGKAIEIIVTDSSSVTNSWVQEITSLYANTPLTVVGLSIERKPNPSNSNCNKSATLQLCVDKKCLILQLFYMDGIPKSLHDFFGKYRKFSFVGMEVDRDLAKLKDEYGLECKRSADITPLSMRRWPRKFRYPLALEDLAMGAVNLYMEKPMDVCNSNWEERVLSDSQVEYACIHAYASYKIGYKLLIKG